MAAARWIAVAVLASPWLAHRRASAEVAGGEPSDSRRGTLTYLWPMHLTSTPLSGPDERVPVQPGGRPPEYITGTDLARELSIIGLKGFQDYLALTLPRELERNPAMAEWWARSDHSRATEAFNRWQKRTFADYHGVPVETLLSMGEEVPRLADINYSWPELYNNPRLPELNKHFIDLVKPYLARCGMKGVPDDFLVYTWVEVFQRGDATKSGSRVQGSHVAGRFFAEAEPGSIKFNIDDERGINPPFGKTYSYMAKPGFLLLHPSWHSYIVTPNMRDNPVVTFGLLAYSANGTRLAFGEDPTIDVRMSKPFAIRMVP